MLVDAFLQERSSRLVTLGRAVIAVFAILAVWLDPSQPAAAPAIAYPLLAAFAVFAFALLLGTSRLADHPRVALAAHLVDMAVFSTLMFLTEGPTSPFFLLFTFSLLTATYRWHWRGALWTVVAVLMLLIGIAAVHPLAAPETAFETDRFVLRFTQVVVIGALLVYFGFGYQQLTEKALRLAAWTPDPTLTARDEVLEECLAHVRRVFAAPFASLVLAEEEASRLAAIGDGGFRTERIGSSLRSRASDASSPACLMPALGQDHGGSAAVLPGAAADAFGPGDLALSVPVHGREAEGRLYVAGRSDFRSEDLPLAAVVASQIGVAIDRIRVMERSRRAAILDERLSLSRDVHDGFLQTLAGTALQLERLKREAERNPGLVQPIIERIQSLLVSEQRELRTFLRRLRAFEDEAAADEADLTTTVAELEQKWNASIRLSSEVAPPLPVEMAFHIKQIVQEAVANAVRHGSASSIEIEIGRSDEALQLAIADDGRGFQEARRNSPPRSLRERVEALGGTLDWASLKGSGVTLSIAIPLMHRYAG